MCCNGNDQKPGPPSGPGSGPGGSSGSGCVDGGSTPCPKCCGCAVGAVIQNVHKFFGATTQQVTYGTLTMNFNNGHVFDFVMTFNYKAGTSGRIDGSFEWNEKVNLPAHATHPAGVWTEMFTVGSPTSPIWVPWNTRSIPCPNGGNMSVTLTDPPSLGNAPGRTLTRTLEFRLVAKSGAGCGCAKNTVTVTATQVLVMVNGVIDEANSSFNVGPTTET
jgi:hypothetical protein